MGAESYYGGRIGASFVIVKRFAGINIPQTEDNKVYKKTYFAIASEEVDSSTGEVTTYYYYPFITKNVDNYTTYSQWGGEELDGTDVHVILSDGTKSQETKDLVLAEGMVQCFMKGGDSTDEVNYGEYVIIDTVDGLGEYTNPDNGKIFRRGMNYDYDPDNNPLAGAEYIGQITGPKGDSPEILMSTVEEIIAEGGKNPPREYTVENQGLRPGKEVNEETGVVTYNDNIYYDWVTVRDKFGNITGSKIGFSFPYLVHEFTAAKRSPYYIEGDDIPEGKRVGDLLPLDFSFINRTDDKKHPYYRQFHFDIPQGIKGDSQNELEICYYKIRKGTELYETPDLTGDPITAAVDYDVDINTYKNIRLTQDHPLSYLPIVMPNGITLYAAFTDGWQAHLWYRETKYDENNYNLGDFIDIGDYRTIENIGLSEDGWLTVFYKAGDDETLSRPLRWLEYDPEAPTEKGVQIEEDGTITFVYNTKADGINNDTQTHNKAMTWITKTELSKDGDFKVHFNNETYKNRYNPTEWVSDPALNDYYYITHIQWINDVNIDPNGTIHFIHNDTSEIIPNVKIKFLTNAKIQTADDSGEEGTGNQKIHLIYNTINPDTGLPEEQDIGEPLNYIIESLITEYNSPYLSSNSEAHHLYVYYSSPDTRASLGANKTYWSKKLGKVINEWYDMGYVRGEPGGMRFIGNALTEDELRDSSGNWILPEDWGPNPSPTHAGWAVTVGDPSAVPADLKIYVYDYEREIWYSIGTINSSIIDNSYIINVEPYNTPDYDITVKEGGIWLVTKTIKYAE